MIKNLILINSFICSVIANNLNVDAYLKTCDIQMSPNHSDINEGYMTVKQKMQFIETLTKYKGIKIVYEIGLNGGHSAETIMNYCPNLTKFVSFDINRHVYTSHAADYFQSQLGQGFIFVPGDSLETVPVYIRNHLNEKPDLIYIDGNHEYYWALNDIKNMREAATTNTILWIDDVPADLPLNHDVARAVVECAKNNIIKIIKIHSSYDPVGGWRSWVEARYIK